LATTLVGAFWNVSKKRWQAQRCGKHLGYFNTDIEAHACYAAHRDAALKISHRVAEGNMNNPYSAYKAAKDAWLLANPGATEKQIEAAFQAIAKRLGL
jgi:hypothetical protein